MKDLQLCTDYDDKPPESAVFQVKEDGIRARWVGAERRLLNRAGEKVGDDVTHRYPDVIPFLPQNATLDVEICVFRWDEQGTRKSVWEGGMQRRCLLENPKEIALRSRAWPCTAYAFDLLEQDGQDVTKEAYRYRLGRLLRFPALNDAEGWPRFVVAESWPMDRWAELVARFRASGLEGVVLRDLGAPYTPGRSRAALRLKFWQRAVFPILDWEITKGRSEEGFKAKVDVRCFGSDEPQNVAVGDRAMRAAIMAGKLKELAVTFLGISDNGRLRQPHVEDSR